MNRVFGSGVFNGSILVDGLDVESLLSKKVYLMDGSIKSAYCILESQDSSFASGAACEGVELYVLGWINEFPNCEINPLDNVSKTAWILLQRYLSEGEKFLEGILGSFIVTVCDNKKGRLLLASDPEGNRRLFIKDDDEEIFFASRLIDISILLGDEVEVDENIEEFLLAYEFFPNGKTMFKGVGVLDPGRLYCLSESEKGYVYSSTNFPQEICIDLNNVSTVKQQLEKNLLSAVKRQIPSKGKVGVLLGGFDSALLVSILKRMGREVETFTFQYDDDSFNQPFIRELTSHFSVRHHWVRISPENLGGRILEYAKYFNQPVSQMHYPIASLLVCEEMKRQGVTHCLTGDGCDGIFLGYPTVYARAHLIERLSKVRKLLKLFKWMFYIPILEKKIGHPYRLVRNVFRLIERPMPARACISACSIDKFSLSLLEGKKGRQEGFNIEKAVIDWAEKHEGESVIRLAYLGKSAVGLNRTKLEGCSSAAGIVLNSPYLDKQFSGFVKKLPQNYLRPDDNFNNKRLGKYILMSMAEDFDYLSENIIYQKKRSPVTAPVDKWYSDDLKTKFEKKLTNLPFSVNSDFMESLFTNKFSERVFRKYIGISQYTSNVLSMLLTYASFIPEKISKGCGHDSN